MFKQSTKLYFYKRHINAQNWVTKCTNLAKLYNELFDMEVYDSYA